MKIKEADKLSADDPVLFKDADRQSPTDGVLAKIISLTNGGLRKLAVYLGGLALFLYGLTRLQPVVEKLFPHSPKWLVIPIASLPLLIVACFELIPELIRNYKAAKLSQRGISVSEDVTSYFKIAPYERSNQDKNLFQRADKAHERVVSWIVGTSEPILYLTGRSGTGKTSLMNAYVLPTLDTSQRIVAVVLRTIDDPIEKLRSYLLQPGIIWKEPTTTEFEDVANLLFRAADRSKKKIVIIFDQFEEILIDTPLSVESKRTREFIRSLVAKKDPRLTILISIRDDYLGPLEEIGLPRLSQTHNWMTISAFTEQASRDFLLRSGLNIKLPLLQSITNEARAIEEVTGLIRPVTLNMIGLVLSVNSAASEGDSLSTRGLQRLILGYVKDSIFRSDIKPFAPKILQRMFTKEGLKKPITIDELAGYTRLSPRVIVKTLMVISSRGLVQRLGAGGETWEISHDFVANLFREAISNWSTRVSRVLLIAAPPLLLLTWLVSLLVVLPRFQTERIVDLAIKSGGTAHVSDGQLVVSVGTETQYLEPLIDLLSKANNVVSLDLSETRVTNEMLSRLVNLPKLQLLNLNDTSIGDEGLDAVIKLSHLRDLRLRTTAITDKGAAKISNLRELEVIVLGGTSVGDDGFAPISKLPALKEVYLNYTLVSAKGLQGLIGNRYLQKLEMNSSAVSDANIENIAQLSSLTVLSLSATRITVTGACAVAKLSHLRRIDVSDNHFSSGVGKCFSAMSSLRDIDLSQSGFNDTDLAEISHLDRIEIIRAKETEITSYGLRYLLRLKTLNSLFIPITAVNDEGMATLSQIPSLEELYVGGTVVSDVGVRSLARLPNLRVLYLIGCKGVTDGSMPYIYAMAGLKTIALSNTGMTNGAIDALIKARPLLGVNRE